MNALKVVICDSLHEENTYFIFRKSGVEVKIQIVGKTTYTTHKLTEIEKEYINSNIIGNK